MSGQLIPDLAPFTESKQESWFDWQKAINRNWRDYTGAPSDVAGNQGYARKSNTPGYAGGLFI